ncbi:MAG: hypothetical protein GWP91_07790 [Rhodobacterales bacterium]|nr:hypothetical protein [Rhodobacterales bacterium]
MLLGRQKEASLLARSVSDKLAERRHASTQTTAYALVALARFSEDGLGSGVTEYTWSLDGSAPAKVSSDKAISQVVLPVQDGSKPQLVVKNASGGVLFTRLITSGLPPLGTEKASANQLAMNVHYRTPYDQNVMPEYLTQGTDFVAIIEVTNTGAQAAEQLALSHIIPSGWEIHGTAPGKGPGYDYRDVRDDRVYTYFNLKPGETRQFEVGLHASYIGHYYMPPIQVEAMYDATIQARTPGMWADVALTAPAG